MSAELAARLIAAAAAAADFDREANEYIAGTREDAPQWQSWAWRLRTDLGILLDQLDTEKPGPDLRMDWSLAESHVRRDGSATLSPADLLAVLSALRTATDHLEHRATQPCDDCTQDPTGLCDAHTADLDNADAYREVSTRLGDEQ